MTLVSCERKDCTFNKDNLCWRTKISIIKIYGLKMFKCSSYKEE